MSGLVSLTSTIKPSKISAAASTEVKGTLSEVSAYSRLNAMQNINFIGNVEGSALPFGVCDVLVTDGFTGNILVKTIEGMGKLLMGNLKGVFLGSGLKGKLSALMVKKDLTSKPTKF